MLKQHSTYIEISSFKLSFSLKMHQYYNYEDIKIKIVDRLKDAKIAGRSKKVYLNEGGASNASVHSQECTHRLK